MRGFKPEATLTEGSNMQDRPVQEDDYDFLKEGRKQTEQRLQKALARVKSMVQYPEARDQYRRLLNVVSDMKDTTVRLVRFLMPYKRHMLILKMHFIVWCSNYLSK